MWTDLTYWLIWFFFSIPGSPSESDIKLGGIDEVSYLQWVLFGAPGVFCQCSSLGLIRAVSVFPCMGGRLQSMWALWACLTWAVSRFSSHGFSPWSLWILICACTTTSSCTGRSHSHHFDYSATVLCVSVLLVFGPSLVGSLTCAAIFHTKLASATSCSCFRFSYLVGRWCCLPYHGDCTEVSAVSVSDLWWQWFQQWISCGETHERCKNLPGTS